MRQREHRYEVRLIDVTGKIIGHREVATAQEALDGFLLTRIALLAGVDTIPSTHGVEARDSQTGEILGLYFPLVGVPE